MRLDIGDAFSDGFERTVARNGLLLAVAFVAVALVMTVFVQTLRVEVLEVMLEFLQSQSPGQAGVSQSEYEQTIRNLEGSLAETREVSPLALDVPLWVAALGLLVFAVASEVVAIVAVRVFASDVTDEIPRVAATENIGWATANGFLGSVVASFLILVGLVLLVVPGIFFAVSLYFLRQEVALNDKNFVEAMADSWRVTRGHRIEVLALVLFFVVLAQLEVVVGGVLGFVSPVARSLGGAVAAGGVGAFGAAVVTRAYRQLEEMEDSEGGLSGETPSDPYDAPLGPDDLPE